MSYLTTVTRKGQVTIPADIRRELNIREGDKVSFSLLPGESAVILVRPVHSIAEMTYGIVASLAAEGLTGEPVDLNVTRELFEEEVARQAMKPLGQ